MKMSTLDYLVVSSIVFVEVEQFVVSNRTDGNGSSRLLCVVGHWCAIRFVGHIRVVASGLGHMLWFVQRLVKVTVIHFHRSQAEVALSLVPVALWAPF